MVSWAKFPPTRSWWWLRIGVFTLYEVVAGIRSIWMHMIFSTGSSGSTLKHTRAYSRLAATQAYALFSSILQISSGSWSDKGFMMLMGLLESVGSACLPSAVVVDMFAFFPSIFVKRCVDENSSHTLAWSWSSGLHMSKIGSGDRSKWWGRLACRQGRFNSSSLPKRPMNASRDDPSGYHTTGVPKDH